MLWPILLRHLTLRSIVGRIRHGFILLAIWKAFVQHNKYLYPLSVEDIVVYHVIHIADTSVCN